MGYLRFRHRYDKLKNVMSGDTAECVAMFKDALGNIPLEFLRRDCAPFVGENGSYDDVIEFFKTFGYKDFGYGTIMEVYWFITDKDIFHTIRKPYSFALTEKVIIQIREE